MKKVCNTLVIALVFSISGCSLFDDYELEWKIEENYCYCFVPPAIGPDGTLYFGVPGGGSSTGHLYAVNVDGSAKWSYPVKSSVSSSPTIDKNGTVYIWADSLYAINPDGTLKWKTSSESYIPFLSGSAAIAEDGTIYLASPEGYTGHSLAAINPDGSKAWAFSLEEGYVSGQPAVARNGTIYFICKASSDYLYAVDQNGTQKWRLEITNGVTSQPAIDGNGVLYLGNGIGELWAINPGGYVEWRFTALSCVRGSPVIDNNNNIYFAVSWYLDEDGHPEKGVLYSLTSTGLIRWKSKEIGMPLEPFSPTLSSNGLLYIGSRDHQMYAFNKDNGDIEGKYRTEYSMCSSPTLGPNGKMYFWSAEQGRACLYALADSTISLAPCPWPKACADNQNIGRAQ